MREILSKEEFVAHIKGLKLEFDKLNKLYSEFGIDTIEMPWCYSSNHFIDLLEQSMGDEYGNISWWCYETDFGRDKNMNKIYDAFGKKVIAVLNTPEDLYDYLVKEDK